MQHKRKKVTKYRGSKTHGSGSMKKRRGAGNRGGRGNAGSGKRGDSKKPSYWKNKRYFNKYGFKNPTKLKINTMNVVDLERRESYLISKNILTEKNGKLLVDLTKLGVDKLLGTGKVTKAYVVEVKSATESAIKKIKEAGGAVNVQESGSANLDQVAEDEPADSE